MPGTSLITRDEIGMPVVYGTEVQMPVSSPGGGGGPEGRRGRPATRGQPPTPPSPPDGDYSDYLDAVLVGGQEKRTVVIADYDPGWPRRYEEQAARIRAALGDRVQRIDHIGSTSVPGLGAKDVVDICVVVADPEDEGAYRADIEVLGYELRVKEPGHRAFRTVARDVNLHVYGADSDEPAKYLLLRDWLRRTPEDCRAYEDLKRRLAGDRDDVSFYAEAKGALIAEMLAKAVS